MDTLIMGVLASVGFIFIVLYIRKALSERDIKKQYEVAMDWAEKEISALKKKIAGE